MARLVVVVAAVVAAFSPWFIFSSMTACREGKNSWGRVARFENAGDAIRSGSGLGKDSEHDGAHRTRTQIQRRGNRREAPTGLLKWLEKAE